MALKFDSIQLSHTGLHEPSQPAIITLPETVLRVISIVMQCTAQNQEFVVRGGGHDCRGRFSVAAAVSIALRQLNSVTISQDKKTARIGGCTKQIQFLSALEEQELHAPPRICGDVGHAGWCLIGGLGPLTTIHGIGLDQIVRATVVNAHGELVEADARILNGLRGGGGCLGVVVELVVKLYTIEEASCSVKRVDISLPRLIVMMSGICAK